VRAGLYRQPGIEARQWAANLSSSDAFHVGQDGARSINLQAKVCPRNRDQNQCTLRPQQIIVASRCAVPQVRVRPLDANLGLSANLESKSANPESNIRQPRVLRGKEVPAAKSSLRQRVLRSQEIPSAFSAAFLRALCVLRFCQGRCQSPNSRDNRSHSKNQLNFPPVSHVFLPMAKFVLSRPFDFHTRPPYHLNFGRLCA
jgi:hypothetical protein